METVLYEGYLYKNIYEGPQDVNSGQCLDVTQCVPSLDMSQFDEVEKKMLATTERRGPHKSMHCKFCKPPGTVYFSDIPTPAQLETKTKLRLSHEVADLKVYDVYDEPGVIAEESEACICQLEGSEACPKCAPDKTRKPVKKKVCTCPVGAKPNPNMAILDVTNQKKKKEKVDDDEFWWEKYEREHDAMVKETWAAYLAQRKLDRKLSKCRELERLRMSGLMRPPWFQKLSCQQTIYLEYLSTAIRLDLDENIIDRTNFVLGGIGFYPRPRKKMLQKCLRYCHYNTVRFLNQLSLLFQEEDQYGERIPLKSIPLKNQDLYSWNDRILMACICHLEFPELLREIMDRLPPLPQEPLPPYIPRPKIRRNSTKHYANPYEEPVWPDQMSWMEKRKLDRMNQLREHLTLKRVKIPSLALVRRPSLIDARPPFLNQIEANQSFNRRRKSSKKKSSIFWKKKKATFDSKVDMTAIAGIEASEVSTTPKADPDEICVFLRGQEPAAESIPEEEETEVETEVEEEEHKIEPILEPRVKYTERLSTKSGSSGPLKMPDEMIYALDDASDEDDDIPFVTPPKTQSGITIDEPCPPPKSSPGPPASHYDLARREIGLINEELCVFDPNEVKSDDDEGKIDSQSITNMDIEQQLRQVVRKLRELNLVEEEEEEEPDEILKKPKKKRRKKKTKKGGQAKAEGVKRKTKSELKGKKKTEENMVQIGDTEENETTDVESSESCVCGPEKQKKKKGKKKRRKSKKRKQSKKKKKTKDEILDPCKTPKKTKSSRDSEETTYNSDSERKTEVESDFRGNASETEEKSSFQEAPVEEEGEEGEKVFYGDVLPLLKTILSDLKEEGFISAGFEEIYSHPDIKQLMMYLHGEILTKKRKESLILNTRWYWRLLDKKGKPRPVIPDLKIPQKRLDKATWNDKKWLTNLIRKKKDEYYYYIAKHRADDAKNLYLSLNQEYFGTERFLKSYYAYMIAARHESIVRGLF